MKQGVGVDLGVNISQLFFSFNLFPVIAINDSLLTRIIHFEHFVQDYPFERIIILLSWEVMLPIITRWQLSW